MIAHRPDERKPRIRILSICPSLVTGGMERQLLVFCKHIDRARFDPWVLYYETGGVFLEELRGLGIPVIHLDKRRLGEWRLMWAIRREIAARRPDVLDCRSSSAYRFGRLASAGLGVPAVVAQERALNKQRTGLRRLLDRVHSRWVDCWIGNSKAVVDHVSRDLGLDPARVCVIYNGIDARPFEQAAALPLLEEKRREGRRVVLNLGNLRPEKNQLLFLQVCDKLRRRFPDLLLVFCGEGSLRGLLEARARALGIADRTLFLGLQDDVAPVLAAADLLIQSSDDEGLPNAVMEAMCARVPIVATEAGGTRELIQDRVHGLVVPVRDEAGLEAGAAELLADRELAARFASAASERIRQEFSVEAMVRRYEDLFSRLVKEGRRKR